MKLQTFFALPAVLFLCLLSEAKSSPLYQDSLRVSVRQDTIMEAVITSEKTVAAPKTQTGHKRLDRLDFIYGNVVFSTPDIIKSIQNLPGVSAGTELMSGLYVHGGEGSDNLFLLDGVPMYQISHLGGLFSSFNADVVSGLDFYKSGFPARYGGRMSSVVDVTTSEGDFEEFHGSFMIGLIDGRLQIEGPLIEGKTSFNLALRRSWMDAVLAPAIAYVNRSNDRGEVIGGNYAFHDLKYDKSEGLLWTRPAEAESGTAGDCINQGSRRLGSDHNRNGSYGKRRQMGECPGIIELELSDK